MSQKSQRIPRELTVSSLSWNPEEVGSRRSEEWLGSTLYELPLSRKQANNNGFLLAGLLCGISPEGVAQVQSGSSCLRRSRFRTGLPGLNDPTKKAPHRQAQ